METKKEFESMPFFLIPPVKHSMISTLDDYIDVILSQIGEEGGKRTIFSYLVGIKDYKHTQKNVQLREIFTGFFDSFSRLKEKLIDKGLEKVANAIEMQSPSQSGFGLIEYRRAYGAKGEFATYRLIEKKNNLLSQIIERWGEEY